MKYRTFSYSPVKGRDITKKDYISYIEGSEDTEVIELGFINPFEEALKKSRRDSFNFSDFQLIKSTQKRTSTSWQGIYSSLIEFLGLRAEDSRVFNMDGVKQFDGIGYCILIPDLKTFIEKKTKENTSKSDGVILNWPKMGKDEAYPREIRLPYAGVDYRIINDDNAKNVLMAKRFCSGLEKEVIKSFKEVNQEWFEEQTGFSKDKLPTRDQSPVSIIRDIEDYRCIAISLIRKETPQYKEIISTLSTELQDLENGIAIKGYKVAQTKEGVYINIKNIDERLSEDRLIQDELIKIEGSFKIAP